MIEFAWINYIKVVSALLVLYYVSIFFIIKKKEKALNSQDRSISNTKDDEYIYSPDNESHVEQIQLDEFLLYATDEKNIPEVDDEIPSDVEENPHIPEAIPDFLEFPDIPDLPEEVSYVDETSSSFSPETLDSTSEYAYESSVTDTAIEEEYESVDISIDIITTNEDLFIDGRKVEDFKNEFLSDEQNFKKEIISFDALMEQNPEIHKTLIEN